MLFSSVCQLSTKLFYTSICGPEFQRTSVIAYSCFCLLYKCFSFIRRTLLGWHHYFKFSGNGRLRNRDGGIGTCCWTLVTVKLCRFRYWYTGIIYVSFMLLNVVSFFYKNEGKRRFVIAFKIVIGLCYFAMNTTQVGFESLFPRQISATNCAFVIRSILVDYFYIEWAHIIIYITVRTWLQGIHRLQSENWS